MRLPTGITPRDYKHLFKSKIDSEDLKEVARTILAAIVMVMAIGLGFLAFAAAVTSDAAFSETGKQKGGGRLVSSDSVAAWR